MNAGSTTGSGTVDLYVYATKLCFMLMTTNVDPTAMHIHLGAAGALGNVALNLGIVDGCVDVPVGITDRALSQPTAFYVNVHSVEFDQGAVRAQLVAPDAITVALTGADVAPTVGSPTGSGSVALSFYDQKVCFSVTFVDVVPTAMHIHEGVAGAGGDVVVEFPTVSAGSGCSLVVDGSQDLILETPSGYYINVHSELYPNGAVRGQLGVAPAAIIESSNGAGALSAVFALFTAAFAALVGGL
jgi:hypothetical protein